MMADVSISEKNTNESVSENNSNNCLDKNKIYTETLTVVIELKDRKKAAYKEDIIIYVKKKEFCYRNLISMTTLLTLLQMVKS